MKFCEGETFKFTDPTEEFIYLMQPVIVNFTNPSGGGVTNIELLPATQFKLTVDVNDFKSIKTPINWADYVWNNVTKRYEKAFHKNKINVFIDSKTKNIVGRNSVGNMIPIKVITVSSEYNYDNVLTVVGENNIPELAEWHVYGNEQQGRFLTVYPYSPSNPNITYTQIIRYGEKPSLDIQNGIFSRQLGKKSYELKDHLCNVRVTHSDIKMPTGTPAQPFMVDLLSKSEYYPYGIVKPFTLFNLNL